MSWVRSLRPIHLAVGVPWIAAVTAAVQPIRDNSFLWHVAAGELQADAGSVLTADPFSFTRLGHAWRTQSWLAELLYAALDDGNLAFVPWLLAVVSLLVFAGVALVAFGASKSVAATAIVGVATAWVGAAFLSPRPVLLSYLLFALAVLAVRDRRLYWALPLILWAWAGIHASFPVALIYIALESLRRRDRRLLGHGVVAGVMTLFTAHGWGIVNVLVGFVENRGALDLITEWAVPDLISVRFLPIVPALLLLIYGAARGQISGRDLTVIGPMVVFMFTASRAVFPAWLGLAAFLASSLSGVWRRSADGVGVAALNLTALAVILLLPAAFIGNTGLDAGVFPLEVAEAVGAERLFHDDVVGGYLIYASRGRVQVFVDDRAELFGEEFFADVIETRSATPTWRDVFENWDIETALLSKEDSLVGVLQSEGWRVESRSEGFLLLERPR